MKERILSFLITILVTMGITTEYTHTNSYYEPIENLYIEQFFDDFVEKELDLIQQQEIAHNIAELARSFGYPEHCDIIQNAKTTWINAQEERLVNKEPLQEWFNKYEEYPYATYVWLYLTKALQFNDYVAAGIMGNMMVETGGNTLNIQYWLYSYGNHYFYGICQWNKSNYPEVRGTDLITQCEFLADTIEYEIDTYGFKYANNYKYEDFINLISYSDAALMFAKSYERCSSSSYNLRQRCAEQAYNYFVG